MYHSMIMDLGYIGRLLLVCLPLVASSANVSADEPDLSILTYNVFLRFPTWIFHDNHDYRTAHISSHVKGHDAIVLQEAFSNDHRQQIIEMLKAEYPHNTQPLGDDEWFSHNGGVAILSRWPMIRQEMLVFDRCRGPDCLVKKGAIYVGLDTNLGPVHLIGLHLQAEVDYGTTRLRQIDQLRTVIKSLELPDDEPVLLAGDFNIDFYTDATDGEFAYTRSVLNLGFDDSNPEPSYHSDSNSILVDASRERLDYVFYLKDHRTPLKAINAVHFIRHDRADLSDHHAVIGTSWFGHH